MRLRTYEERVDDMRSALARSYVSAITKQAGVLNKSIQMTPKTRLESNNATIITRTKGARNRCTMYAPVFRTQELHTPARYDEQDSIRSRIYHEIQDTAQGSLVQVLLGGGRLLFAKTNRYTELRMLWAQPAMRIKYYYFFRDCGKKTVALKKKKI